MKMKTNINSPHSFRIKVEINSLENKLGKFTKITCTILLSLATRGAIGAGLVAPPVGGAWPWLMDMLRCW